MLVVLLLAAVLQQDPAPPPDAAAPAAPGGSWEQPADSAEVTTLKACIAAISTEAAAVACGAIVGAPPPTPAECDFMPSWRQRGDCAVATAVTASEQVRSQSIDCDEAMTMVDMTQCANERLAWETVRLEIYLRGAMIRAYDYARTELEYGVQGGDPHPYARQFIDDLESAQRQWEDYAGTVCGSVGQQYRGGSIQPMMEMACLEDLGRDRMRMIWAYSLGGADGDETWPEPKASDQR